MGQIEILKHLQSKKKFISTKELRESLKSGQPSISRCIHVLYKSGDVERIKVKQGSYWIYKYKVK
jgi:predicted transcriptional regulator